MWPFVFALQLGEVAPPQQTNALAPPTPPQSQSTPALPIPMPPPPPPPMLVRPLPSGFARVQVGFGPPAFSPETSLLRLEGYGGGKLWIEIDGGYMTSLFGRHVGGALWCAIGRWISPGGASSPSLSETDYLVGLEIPVRFGSRDLALLSSAVALGALVSVGCVGCANSLDARALDRVCSTVLPEGPACQAVGLVPGRSGVTNDTVGFGFTDGALVIHLAALPEAHAPDPFDIQALAVAKRPGEPLEVEVSWGSCAQGCPASPPLTITPPRHRARLDQGRLRRARRRARHRDPLRCAAHLHRRADRARRSALRPDSIARPGAGAESLCRGDEQ